jgi:deazaflavin-dependent oxidoreductase (nitroreductase family)
MDEVDGSVSFAYLTTTGRRTGRPHRIEIWFASGGAGTLYLLAGGGHESDWVRNLVADPDVVVEVGSSVRHGRARVLGDGAESERARTLVHAKYAPRSGGDLTGWRRESLPVAIDLTDA